MTILDRLFDPPLLRLLARTWLIAAICLFALHLWLQTTAGLTDGVGHPFGDDTLNFWSAARLALLGRAHEVYDLVAFHRFEVEQAAHDIDFYHYSYPPILLLLTLPLGLLPFWTGWLAWLTVGWVGFALCLRRVGQTEWLLGAAAWPAVFICFISGQNGAWTAAMFGWGLVLLAKRPVLAGLVLSLLAYKPQLAMLIPLALLAARQRRALAGMTLGGVILLAAPTLLFGPDIWVAYLHQTDTLRSEILEQGDGVWHRMISIFVLMRHLGLPVRAAYVCQAVVSVLVAAVVALVWHSDAPRAPKSIVLVLGALIASPYVSDYDLVVTAFVPAWFSQAGLLSPASGRIAVLLVVAASVAAAPIAVLTGAAAGGLVLIPAMAIAARAALTTDLRRRA